MVQLSDRQVPGEHVSDRDIGIGALPLRGLR
jgi:hypothetical protein